MADADSADDRVFIANTPAQAESLQHSLERAARVIGLYVNSNKSEFVCFKEKEAISTLCGKPLKLED